jgi:Tfp pilus assembly protein PilP
MQNEDRKGYIDSSSASFDSTPIPKIPEFKKKTLAQIKAEKPPRFTKKDDLTTPMQAKGLKAKATQMKKSLAEFVANPFLKATLIAT